MESIEHVKANLDLYNQVLKQKSVEEIIEFGLQLASSPILTSNFGPYSASLIHAVSQVEPNIRLIWCDTGFNTTQTLSFADHLKKNLPFQLHVYKPIEHDYKKNIPNSDSLYFQDFVNKVKLEPFKRALDEHTPDVWFTNIRKGQTAYRDTLNILSINNEGILRISPFYFWSETEIEEYLDQNGLPNEFAYYDPTKSKANLECGIQL